jgi:hypothetical protein
MIGGIGDSFLKNLGFSNEQVEKVDLTYKGHKIPRLGLIIHESISMEELTSRLIHLNLYPSRIINPQNLNQTIGYILGGGFTDTMIIEMAEAGVGVQISSDPNWVVEILARELGMTLISINHYISEYYGLSSMQKILTTQFPQIPVSVCEKIKTIQLDDLVQDLYNLALKDGNLSKDEDRLIETVIINIEKFKKTYIKAWKDDIITTDYKLKLKKLWKKVYDQSIIIASQDHLITQDESILLTRDVKTINNSIFFYIN